MGDCSAISNSSSPSPKVSGANRNTNERLLLQEFEKIRGRESHDLTPQASVRGGGVGGGGRSSLVTLQKEGASVNALVNIYMASLQRRCKNMKERSDAVARIVPGNRQ